MTDFDIQQVKKKLEQDLQDATKKGDVFEKDSDTLLKKAEALEDIEEKEDQDESKNLAQIQAELDESLNNAVLDLAGKER
ncbi:MAG: hypothetical protein KBB54_01690 [Candidatus Pacebacteria bacterium]|nr:hypothetical protein [Candidatus Paceibacterota bacterium]MBP9818611.1 hypothetical protein [Candidatus Paceibacterota bacterium]